MTEVLHELLDVQVGGRTVIIDGERFPLFSYTEWPRGGEYQIPLESGLFLEFWQGGRGEEVDWSIESPLVSLAWHQEDFDEDHEWEWPGVILDSGQFVRQSQYSAAGSMEHVASGRDVRKWAIQWSRHLPIVDSARLREELANRAGA